MYLCNVKNIKIMKINLERIKSGMAGGKQIVVVDGYGSFQPTYVQLYALGMSVMYISHSKKNADIKLCLTLQDVANHLGCDCNFTRTILTTIGSGYVVVLCHLIHSVKQICFRRSKTSD